VTPFTGRWVVQPCGERAGVGRDHCGVCAFRPSLVTSHPIGWLILSMGGAGLRWSGAQRVIAMVSGCTVTEVALQTAIRWCRRR
jgi:hypothetical protein